MNFNSIVIKLSVVIIMLSFMIIFPLGFTINKIFSSFYYSDVETKLDELATNYASMGTDFTDPLMLTMFEKLGMVNNQALFIVNSQGIVIVSSGLANLGKGTTIYQNDVQSLQEGKTIKKEFSDPATGERYLTVGKPIKQKGTFIGGIFIATPIEGIYQSIAKVKNMIKLASVGAILVSIGFALFLSKQLSIPLLKMVAATRKIAKGDLDSRVYIQSKDEIGSLANEINQLAIELQRYQDNRSEFFANISHELRTPLTYIDGFSKAIRKKLYKSEEEKDHMFALVEQETARMTKMVDDLFELAKMEEEKLDVHFELIDLNEVVEAAASKIQLKAEEKGLILSINGNDALPFIKGDGLRLEQIVINVLENAIRYTDKGKVGAKLSFDSRDVIVVIEDTGIGIPEKDIPYLFDRFYRVDKSRSRKMGGTGLGLAIVKQLVDLHKGTIAVFSESGKGTRFQIHFPIYMREDR